MDWLKAAKELKQKEEKKLPVADAPKENPQLLQSESNWMDRVNKRVQEIILAGFTIHVRQKPNYMELTLKGKVILQLKEHQHFEVTYYDVVPPSMLILRDAVTVHHHRVVQLRELSAGNIEEILKFVVLGMQEYCRLAKHSRIERNLQHIKAVNRLDQHI